MPTARSRCHKCSGLFDLSLSDMRVRTQKDPKTCNYREPRSYADWEAHVVMTCPGCRIRNMPDSCLADLDRLIAQEQSGDDRDPYEHYDSFA